MTKCGHSFCHSCILRCLEQSFRCPKCNCHLENSTLIPNFALEELVAKAKTRNGTGVAARAAKDLPEDLRRALVSGPMAAPGSGPCGVGLNEIDDMIRILVERREEMEAESFLTQHTLLSEFLTHLKRGKDDELMRLKRVCDVIQDDLNLVNDMMANIKVKGSGVALSASTASVASGKVDDHDVEVDEHDKSDKMDQNVPPQTLGSGGGGGSSDFRIPTVPDNDDDDSTAGFNSFRNNKSSVFRSTLPQRRRRMNDHFPDLSSCYFSCRAESMMFPPMETPHPGEQTTGAAAAAAAAAAGAAGEPGKVGELGSGPERGGLEQFSSCLSKFTRYSRLHPLATLNYAPDMFTTASIVSSIEFDKDRELFAIAGVTKRIKVYDYGVILKDMVDIHYPSNEMLCSSKISCISWNPYHKSTLASSDYDCSVIVWDVATGQRVKEFKEHQKRCWSVDFNNKDPKLLASGSDDTQVKLWSVDMNQSVTSLEAKRGPKDAGANVCCVKFNPSNCYHIAFGSSDHCVHYYDFRHTKHPLNVFKGHRKAVSYVKFLNSTDIVSASTDSQLKLWNVNQKNCIRSFTGHSNEKNFVGLATDGDYITCGSENNSLYMYYKGLSKPLFSFRFDTMRSLLDRPDGSAGGSHGRHRHGASASGRGGAGAGGAADAASASVNGEFVSAVTWRQNSPVVVAANSQGTIKVLELV